MEWQNHQNSSTLCRMATYVRCGPGGLGLVVTASLSFAGCAPPCYDDGLLQGGCPQAETDSDSATDSMSGTMTASASMSATDTIAEASADDAMMTADGGSGSDSDSSGSSGTCPDFSNIIAPETRTFKFVVEQSGFMSLDLDGVSRYDAVREVLLHPMDGVATSMQMETRFGMTVYRGLQTDCPVIDSVLPQLDSADEMDAMMGLITPIGTNVVPEAFADVVTELEADPAPGDKTIILATGAEPGTCDIPSPLNAIDLATTRAAALDAVMAAHAAGFPTIVISMGTDIEAGYLQLLANVGIGHMPGDPDATFYTVEDRGTLHSVLQELLASNRPCEFSMEDAVSAELAPSCEVVVNGAPVVYEDPDGWSLPDPQTLSLQGGACDSIQSGLATIAMTCSCDA